jgi:hypothetical protein
MKVEITVAFLLVLMHTPTNVVLGNVKATTTIADSTNIASNTDVDVEAS